MKQRKLSAATSIFAAAMLALMPITVCATGADDEPGPKLPPVIITEVQPGVTGGNADDEFIELYNTTDEAIDINGWELWYNPKVVAASNPPVMPAASGTIVIGNGTSEAVIIPAGGYYLLTSDAYSLATPDGVGSQEYAEFAMTYDASLRLLSLDKTQCTLSEIDRVGWGATLIASGVPVHTTSTKRGVVRMADDLGYAHSGVDVDDFAAVDTSYTSGAVPPTNMTPGQDNGVDLKAVGPTEYEPSVYNSLSDVLADAPNCGDEEPADDPEDTDDEAGGTTVPEEDWPPAEEEQAPKGAEDEDATEKQPTIPAANAGLKSPVLSELLPNPVSPLTDANDEFIELYNPNDAYFDLSGYVLEVGLTTTRRYIIPAGTKIAPRAFLAFFSAQSNLALSNSGSQVALLDPLGRTLVQSDAYGTAKGGQAWVFANGIWQWTTKPTPNALNVVSAPAVKSKSTTKKSKAVSTASAKKTVATSKPTNTNQTEDTEQTAALAAVASTPLHPTVLALIAASAVLYGAYEYRRDMANRIYQFRTNRTARRAARQSPEGR